MFAIERREFSALGFGVGVVEVVFGVSEMYGVGFNLVMAIIDGSKFSFGEGMVKTRGVIVFPDIKQVHYGLNLNMVMCLHVNSISIFLVNKALLLFFILYSIVSCTFTFTKKHYFSQEYF